MREGRRRLGPTGLAAALVASAVLCSSAVFAQGETTVSLTVRGKALTVRTFGTRGRPPVVVSSGDGGWVHLGPHIAQVLAARGFFVVGVDSKEYLSKFTVETRTLAPSDVPGDFRVFVDFASSGAAERPVLVGVSEGAGLAVLAASNEDLRGRLRGVIGVGLPDVAELGWRWRDNAIYFTHKTPNEPVFSTAEVIAGVSPLPMAAIHSTRDEFVPLESVKTVMTRAKEPKRLWVIDAADHGFSDKRPEFDARLLEALGWIASGGK
jgi:alpha-beta hydrolase superfamily lysophospholipase